jgi:sarcosine oxidase delta subunit
VALKVPCPNCGWRPATEFAWGGELRPVDAPDAESEFARVFLLRTLPVRRTNDGSIASDAGV